MGMCTIYLQDRSHFQSHVHQAFGQGCIMTDGIAQRRLHVQALRSVARTCGVALVRDDVADLKAKRRPIQRTALKARVRCLMASQKAKSVTKNYVFGLRKVCEEVRRKRGAASRG